MAKIQPGVSLTQARRAAHHFLRDLVDSEVLDTDLILGYCTGLSRIDVMTISERILTGAEVETFKALLQRRARGEPVAYLLGEKEFFGLNFHVNQDVLIPRPDTEIMVEAAIEFLKQGTSQRVIDVCTGSGCVGISIAHQVKDARVIATDISEKALAVARRNAKDLGVEASVEFRHGNLLEPCAAEGGVDLIVSNPPYIRPSEMTTLMKDVRDFEPHLALLAEDEDGLGLHRKILEQSLPLLRSNGALMMELGVGQAEILSSFTPPGFSPAIFLKDYAGIWRIVKYNRLPSQ